MKRLYPYLLLYLIIFVSCTEDNPVNNNCEEFLEVKSQEQLRVDHNLKYCNIYLSKYVNGILDEDSKYLNKIEFFDENGYADSTIILNPDGTMDKISVNINDEYYNNLGWKTYYPGKLPKTYILFKYEYNEKGLLIRESEIDELGIPYSANVYSYNSNDQIIEMSRYEHGELVYLYKYFYTKYCNKPTKMKAFSNGNLAGTVYIEYDKFGNITRARLINSDGDRFIDEPMKYV